MKNLTLVFALLLGASSTFAQAPAWQWARQSIGEGHDYGMAIAADAQGNIYVTGTFQPDSVILGNDTLTASSNFNSGYFVAKYDRDGNELWARTITGSAGMDPTAISLNLTEDVLVVSGDYKSVGYINFGADSISSGMSFFEAFIAKYDTAGNSIWARNAGPSAWNGQIHFKAEFDSDENVYVGGTFEDSIYLKKFDPNGIELWNNKYIGNMNNTFPWSIDVNAAGESVVAGYFANTSLQFDTTVIGLSSNGYTIVLVKSDAQGNVLWVKNDGQIASLYKPDIALGPNDEIYVTGYFNGATAVFGNTILQNQGIDDIFIVKYDPSGSLQWAVDAGGFHFDHGIAITVDQYSNCYITGLFRVVAQFGNFTLFNQGDPDVYVAKYSPYGIALWAKKAGGDLVENGFGIAVDDSTNCYVTGAFTSMSPAFDNIMLLNSSPQWTPYDVFIAKLGADTLTSTGIAEPAPDAFVIYPNPLVSESTLMIPGGQGKQVIEMYDVRGALVRKSEFSGNNTKIPKGKLSPGTYVIRLISGKSVSEKLLMVE